MTHYATLGVAENATQDEIKKSYRKLASQHHPDRGGDTATFQTIQAAYDVIGDEQKRQQYDHERKNPGGIRFTVNGQEMSGMPGGMDDILRNFGFNFGGGFANPFEQMNPHRQRRNKDLRVEIMLPLASTLVEQKKTINVSTTNGHNETVEVTIPRGVTNDAQIKYSGLGDNFFNTLPRGDLYIHFRIEPQANFTTEGLDLVTGIEIGCLDAITGGETEITGIDGTKFVVSIQPGTQPGTTLRIPSHGLWQLNSSQRGNLLVKIIVTVPRNLTADQLELINQIKKSQ